MRVSAVVWKVYSLPSRFSIVKVFLSSDNNFAAHPQVNLRQVARPHNLRHQPIAFYFLRDDTGLHTCLQICQAGRLATVDRLGIDGHDRLLTLPVLKRELAGSRIHRYDFTAGALELGWVEVLRQADHQASQVSCSLDSAGYHRHPLAGFKSPNASSVFVLVAIAGVFIYFEGQLRPILLLDSKIASANGSYLAQTPGEP